MRADVHTPDITTKQSTMHIALHTCVYMLCSVLFLQRFCAYNCPCGAPLYKHLHPADSRQHIGVCMCSVHRLGSLVMRTYTVAHGRNSRPSGARSRRASCATQPCHQDSERQGASRQHFRDVTALVPRLQCPSWSRPTATGTHNSIFKPLHCLEKARPKPWSVSVSVSTSAGAQAPSAFITLVHFLDPSIRPPIIQPAIVTTSPTDWDGPNGA